MKEDKLWKAFSIFIRTRDADENGMCKCFTCGFVNHWKKMDCGHGIPRQYKATKYDEKNNQVQCKRCNGFEGGKREVFKVEMDKKYGAGTWDLMELKSRQVCRRGQFEIEALTKYYKEKTKQIA